LVVRASTASWVSSTNITDDTEFMTAAMNEDVMGFVSKAIKESQQYRGVKTDADTTRKLMLLKFAASLPAPSDPAKRSELASIAAKLEGLYGKAKWCAKDFVPGKGAAEDQKKCRDIGQLAAVLEAQWPKRRCPVRVLARVARDVERNAPALRAVDQALERRGTRSRLRRLGPILASDVRDVSRGV